MAKKEEAKKAEALKAKEKAQLQVLDQVEEGTIDELISGESGSCVLVRCCSNPL